MDYYTWTKGDNNQLSEYFSQKEFTCQCNLTSCVDQKISKDLVEKLTNLRKEINIPLKITSGYRCQAHQDELAAGGLETAKKSQHVLGNAADVACKNMELLTKVSEKYFTARGIANTFVHLDTRSAVITWTYKKS